MSAKVQATADGIKVRLLEGNAHGQVGEEVVLSTSVAKAAIEKGTAEIVAQEEAVDASAKLEG